MGDVKRYTYRYSEVDGELHRVEEPEGHYVLHSDYEEMETNRNQLGWAITGLVAENEMLDDELSTLRAENSRLKGEVERLRDLVRNLVDEDPNETIADNGATVLDLWRHHARAALSRP